MNFADVRHPFTFIVAAMFAVVTFLPTPARCEPPSEIPWSMLQERDADGGLLPAYRHTMRRPLEYFGISIWSGPEEGGGYMGALADPAVVAAGGTNVFIESEVVETADDYRQLAELGVNFLPFTHTLFSPTYDERGFYTYDKVEEIIGYLEKLGVPASAYLGLANHPGFPLFTLAYGQEDSTRQQRDTAGRPIYRAMPSMDVVNPALSWDHPDLAGGAIRSAAHHARAWKDFSNIPFWCLMGENLFAGKEADTSEVHRRHFGAWLRFRYKTVEAWSAAWGLDTPKAFSKTPPPRFGASETPTAAQRDMARFRRDSMAELYRAVRGAVRAEDPDRIALGLFHASVEQQEDLIGMGVHADRIAMVTDGIASSHILWPHTSDPRNLINLAVFRSFGRPVVVPIFGLEQDQVINDFTSSNYKVERIARRVYEHLGMGAWGLAVGYWKVWGWTLAHHEEGKREIARLAAELKRLAPESELMQPVSCPVGFFIGSDDAALAGMPEVYEPLFAAALRRGLPVEFVYEERLLSGRPAVPKVLVVAAREGISSASRQKLRTHVREGGSVLLWPTGPTDWTPSDVPRHERVYVVPHQRQPDPTKLVDRLADRAGPAALPVRYGDGSKGLETFALVDGVGAMVVAINSTNEPLENATFTLAEHLTAGEARWHVRVGDNVNVQDRRVTVSLKPHGVAVLYGEAAVADNWDLAGEQARLTSALGNARAEGFDVTRPRADLLAAAGHLAAERRSKAAACLLHARRTLLVRLESTTKGDTFSARVRVASLAGELSESTEVELRLPDHRDVRMKLEKVGPGQFQGRFLRDERLAVYDYDAAAYEPDPGPVAVEAEARAGTAAGASPIVMWMP